MDVRILGPLEVREDGRTFDLGGPRPRALFTILVLSLGEVVPAERLADELWGEAPPKSADHLLHVYVSSLRKELGARLVTRAPGYLLELDPDELDARRFERLLAQGMRLRAGGDHERASETLGEALGLWRGPVLADFMYEPFAQREITRLGELRLTALEQRIEADLGLGRDGELVGELEALIAEHPLRERFRAQLMLALYRSGRQADALAAYQYARRTLVEDLGLEPSQELQDLERAILTHDPALTRPPSRTAPEPVAAPPTGARRRTARRRRTFLVAGLLLLAGVIAASAAVLTRSGESAPLTGPADAVAIVDPTTQRVVGHVSVGAHPVAVAVGHGSVWIANADDGTVSRIDPKTRKVLRTIGIGTPVSDLAVSADAVWVANGSDGTVSRIDPGSNAVVAKIDLRGPNLLAPRPVHALTLGAGAIWVASGDNLVVRIDPATNKVEAEVGVPSAPVDLAADEEAIWAELTAERLARIEPRTNEVSGTVAIGDPVSVAAGTGAIWIADLFGVVWRVDPATVAVTDTVRVGGELSALAIADDAVWITSSSRGEILRIDPQTMGVAATVRLGSSPTDVAVGYGALWVTIRRADGAARASLPVPGTSLRRLQTPPKVGLVLDAAGLDDPYLGATYLGLKRAVEELGVEGIVLTHGPKEGALAAFSHLSRQEFDLVIGVGFLEREEIDAAALRYPEQRFILVDAPWEALPHKPRNVLGVTFRVEEAAYLAGHLAALVERQRPGADVISSVGGVKIPPVDAFIAGYRAGARSTNAGIAALNAYARSFLDPSKCRAVALSQIAKGAGVVFSVAGACGVGALDAAKRNGVFGVGVDTDQSALGPHVLTSVVKRLDVAVFDVIRATLRGKLKLGKTETLGLHEGVVGLGKVSSRVPQSVIARVSEVNRQILAGEIKGIPTSVPSR